MSNGTQHRSLTGTAGNKGLIEQLLVAWNSHDVPQILSYYGPEYAGIENATVNRIRGQDGARRFIERLLQAFPDYEIEAQQLIGDGDLITVVWQANGTHRGELLSIPPTERQVTLHGVTVYTVASGCVTKSHTIWDVAGWLRQIGLLPRLHEIC